MLGSERLIICVGFPGYLFGVEGGLGTTCWWVVRIFFRGRINVEHFRVPKGSAPRCPCGVDDGLGIIVSLIDGIFGKTAFMLGKQAFLFSFGGWNNVLLRLANVARRRGISSTSLLDNHSLLPAGDRLGRDRFTSACDVSMFCKVFSVINITSSISSFFAGLALFSLTFCFSFGCLYLLFLILCTFFSPDPLSVLSALSCHKCFSVNSRLRSDDLSFSGSNGDRRSSIVGRDGCIRFRNSALNFGKGLETTPGLLLGRAWFFVGVAFGKVSFSLGTVDKSFSSISWAIGKTSSLIVGRLNKWLTEAAPRKTFSGWMVHRRISWTIFGKQGKTLWGFCRTFLISFTGIPLCVCLGKFSGNSRLTVAWISGKLVNETWTSELLGISVAGEEQLVLDSASFSLIFSVARTIVLLDVSPLSLIFKISSKTFLSW